VGQVAHLFACLKPSKAAPTRDGNLGPGFGYLTWLGWHLRPNRTESGLGWGGGVVLHPTVHGPAVVHKENSVGKDQEVWEEIDVGPRATKPKKLINFSSFFRVLDGWAHNPTGAGMKFYPWVLVRV
jgi:hypothetical protein